MYKGIIFDMDGVLLETEQHHYEAWRQVFSEYGVALTHQDYQEKCQSQGRERAIKNVFGDMNASTMRQVSEKKGKAYHKAIETFGVTLFEDARRLLERVKVKQIKLAIASSSKSARMVIDQTEYAGIFEHIITGIDVKENKPNPEIFEMACHKLGLKPNEVVVIEDSIVGIQGAVSAGMDVIGINRNHSLEPLNLEAIKTSTNITVIQSLDEIFHAWLPNYC